MIATNRVWRAVVALVFAATTVGCATKSHSDTGDVLGRDENRDGVRDDVEALIRAKYADSARAQAMLMQAAGAEQAYLRDAANSTATAENAKMIARSAECAYAVRGEEGRRDMEWLHAQMLDTKQRTDAYLQAQSSLGRADIIELSDDPSTSCNFNIASLPN